MGANQAKGAAEFMQAMGKGAIKGDIGEHFKKQVHTGPDKVRALAQSHPDAKVLVAAGELHKRAESAYKEVASKVNCGEASWETLKLVHQRKMDDVLRQWAQAAAEGHPIAQLNLGKLYEKGEGAVKDSVKAAGFYRLSADQGVAEAQHRLGVMYKQGQGLAQSDAKAVELIRKAADQGYADAQVIPNCPMGAPHTAYNPQNASRERENPDHVLGPYIFVVAAAVVPAAKDGQVRDERQVRRGGRPGRGPRVVQKGRGAGQRECQEGARGHERFATGLISGRLRGTRAVGRCSFFLTPPTPAPQSRAALSCLLSVLRVIDNA